MGGGGEAERVNMACFMNAKDNIQLSFLGKVDIENRQVENRITVFSIIPEHEWF